MNLSIMKLKKVLFPVTGLLVLIIGLIILATLQGTSSANKKKETPKKRSAFEHVLKVNKKIVDVGIFRRERRIFFKRYKTDGAFLRKTEEESNDIFFNQVIERMVLQTYVEKNAKKEITQNDVDDYIENKLKSIFSNEAQYNGYLEENGLENENDLKIEIKFYLQRLQCLPEIAQEKGITLDDDDKNRIAESKTLSENSILVSKFLASDEFKKWIEEVKKDTEIEIISPAVLAYRYYKQEDFKNAEKYYRKAYKQSKTEKYLKKAQECNEKIK